MATVTGNADQVRVGPGKLLLAPYGTPLPADLGDTLNPALVEVGFTTEGSSLTYSQTADGVEVAERLRPIKTVITAVEMTFAFTFAQLSAEHLRIATNSPTSAVTTTAGGATKFTWPKAGGTARQSIVWLSDDDLEMLVLSKCFAGGDIEIPRRKGTDPAAIGVTFTIEENSDVTIGGGADAFIITDASLVA
jgi:hypothetical protein